jgi:hypothetical protein
MMRKQINVRVLSTSPDRALKTFGTKIKKLLKKQELKGSFDFIFKSPTEVACRERTDKNLIRSVDFHADSITIGYYAKPLKAGAKAANANTIVYTDILSGTKIPKLMRGRMKKLHQCVNDALGKKRTPVSRKVAKAVPDNTVFVPSIKAPSAELFVEGRV